MARFLWVFCAVFGLCVLSCNSYSLAKRSKEPEQREKPSTSKLQLPLQCETCNAVVSALWLVLEWDEDNDVVPELASSICELVAKQSSVVCQGITTQFKEEFFYVFRQLAEKNPSAVCGLLMDECSDPNDQNGSGWAIVLPPKPTKELKAIIDKKRAQSAHPRGPDHRYLRVLQLSDVHVDFDYKPGSEAKCDLFLCCRNTTGKPKKPAGYWGTVATCDIPYRMFRNMLEHINATAEIDYIMLSGDFIDHAIWTYSIEGHKKALRNVSALIREFFPLTPTYWAIGNHEGVPTNSFAPHFVDKRFWPTWLYEEFSIMGAPWLNNEALKTMLYRGSYSVKVTDGLRLISLNTGFCENTNFFLYLNQSDPDGTMTWFVSELFKAELTGESVHVLSHIPPGDGECLEGWARNYYRVVQRFADTIRAQFFGHVHFDQFTVFYDDMHNVSSTPIGVLYVAPSVTTYTNVNPAYRIYDIDLSDKFNVANIRNYYADLTKTNEKTPPKWTMLYAAKEKYNLHDLSPASWNKAANSILHDEQIAKEYFRNAFRVKNPECDSKCQQNLLCSLRMGHHNSTLYCPQNKWRRSSLANKTTK